MSEWNEYRDESLTEWYFIMNENKIYERVSMGSQWNKPIWYEIMNLHIKQVKDIQINEDKVREEMFGLKAYLKAT